MKTIYVENCPICNSSKKEIFIHKEEFHSLKNKFSIEKCQSCGFLFTQDFPSEEFINSYYELTNYISHTDSSKGFINSIYHVVRSFALKNKARLIEKYIQKGTLLDIGAGTGYFVNEMRKRAWNVSAIEKNLQARLFIKNKWDIEAMESEALFTLPENSFNVITLWHVLEHLEGLNEVMAKLYSILATDGLLIVALPNSASYDAKKYNAFWAAYDLPLHLWHFNPQTFELLAIKHGFEIKKIKRLPFDVFYISLLSEKHRGKSFKMFRAFFYGFIGSVKSIFNIRETSSLIYVLKKK